MVDPELDKQLTGIAPSVFCAHSYFGTCISGTKTLSFPRTIPCRQRFGWSCLLRYYPRRVGGLNPATMVRCFRTQHRRLRLLSEFRAIITLSAHMRQEYIRHGFAPDSVFTIPPPLKGRVDDETTGAKLTVARPNPDVWRLLFLGRMDRLKGGAVLLDALHIAANALHKKLHVTFAGEGPERLSWERRAQRLMRRYSDVQAEFVGWVDRPQIEALFLNTDLFVLPSLWPEPFGLVGIEAACYSVPAVAFAVGGVPEWLHDGVNGHLAPGHPASHHALGAAIVSCLEDSSHYKAIQAGAAEVAGAHSVELHLSKLLDVFNKVAGT
jgi:glycosyltransferase involved in cell wall biosynthesis